MKILIAFASQSYALEHWKTAFKLWNANESIVHGNTKIRRNF